MIKPEVVYHEQTDEFYVWLISGSSPAQFTREQLLTLRRAIEKELNEQDLCNVLKRADERARRQR